MSAPTTLGVVLAGGLARRMGGGDKPLMPLAGRTLLARVVARFGPQCDGLLLNANGDPARFAETGLPVVPDGVEGFAGPLAGVLAALDWARVHRPGVAWVASAASDSPFLPRDLVAGLHAARESARTPLACAQSGAHAHPVAALWPVALATDLRRALVEEGLRRIDRWTTRHGIAHAAWAAEPVDPFFNANAPDDLAEAERLIARHGEP